MVPILKHGGRYNWGFQLLNEISCSKTITCRHRCPISLSLSLIHIVLGLSNNSMRRVHYYYERVMLPHSRTTLLRGLPTPHTQQLVACRITTVGCTLAVGCAAFPAPLPTSSPPSHCNWLHRIPPSIADAFFFLWCLCSEATVLNQAKQWTSPTSIFLVHCVHRS